MISRIEELALITRCATADSREAFSRLVVEYEKPLRRFLLNLTLNDYELTADLSQETFLKAYLAIRSYRGLSRFRTWLFKIAYNEFLDHKRRSSHALPFTDAYQMADYSDRHASIDSKIDATACLAQLSDAERSVALLFYLEDLPIKKIVEITAMPEGTVKSYLSRARTKMAEFYEKN